MRKSKPATRPVNQLVPVKSEPEECCGTCHCWRDGRCKRYPPSKIAGQQVATQRPVTAKDDWCGDWQRAG